MALVFPQAELENWVLMSLLVAVQSPLRGKEQNAHLLEQGAFEALPRNTRASRLLFKGGALLQSTYGHQIWGLPSMKRLGPAAAWIPSWDVYHHSACYHKN